MQTPAVPTTATGNERVVTLTPYECKLILTGLLHTRAVARMNMTDRLLNEGDRQMWRRQFDTCGNIMVQLGVAAVEPAPTKESASED